MEREDHNGGWKQESQLRLTGRDHPSIVVEVRARSVHLLQRDVGRMGFRVVCSRLLVGVGGLDQMAMRQAVSELRKENGNSQEGAL